jgi:uncharacterized protein (DUF1697 family)
MGEFVVLLRAVNVGKRQLKMAEARKVLQDNDFVDVESHIQTGNFLLSTSLRSTHKVEEAVGAALSRHAGFDIVAIARRPRELPTLVEAVDVVPEQPGSDTLRYVMFCAATPSAAKATELEEWRADGERAVVLGKDVLVDFAVPFAQAKLTGARIERILGVAGTARNMTVVRAMAQKWGS